MINAIKYFIPQFSQKLCLDTVTLPGGIIIFIVHCNAKHRTSTQRPSDGCQYTVYLFVIFFLSMVLIINGRY